MRSLHDVHEINASGTGHVSARVFVRPNNSTLSLKLTNIRSQAKKIICHTNNTIQKHSLPTKYPYQGTQPSVYLYTLRVDNRLFMSGI
jgi:hypothetical protein